MKRMIGSLAAIVALAVAVGVMAHEETKKEPVKSAQFSPDGQRIVTASADGTTRVWDAKTGKALTALQERGGAHLGTWQLISFKYGTNQPDFTDFPQAERRIKHITDTHFTWVQFDAATKKVSAAAGGTYSLTGSTYTESIDFGLEMDTYLGQKHAFTIRVEGDKLFQSGSLADGLKIEEVWQRVK